MQIIQSIAAWAAQQPAWIDDAVRRLVAGGLTPQDFQELSALAKAEHGLPDPKGRVAVRLDPKTLPAAAQDGVDVSLSALRCPQNLNAIDSNQVLTFQATGLTIVYGHNGAGKSGYARTLKKACRARNVEDILPDVYVESKGPVLASAVFDWSEGQAAKSQRWTVGTVPPEPLSRMSVFDAHCARVFVDNQAKVLFVPDGMEVIHGLSDVLGGVQRLIEADRKGVTSSIMRSFPRLPVTMSSVGPMQRSGPRATPRYSRSLRRCRRKRRASVRCSLSSSKMKTRPSWRLPSDVLRRVLAPFATSS